VHVPLGHPLAVEVGDLLDEMGVVQQDRAVGPRVSELRSLGAGAPAPVVELPLGRASGLAMLFLQVWV